MCVCGVEEGENAILIVGRIPAPMGLGTEGQCLLSMFLTRSPLPIPPRGWAAAQTGEGESC